MRKEKSERLGFKIGDEISIKAIIEKGCDHAEGCNERGHRLRLRQECNKVGYVIGIRKKLLRWSVEYKEDTYNKEVVYGHNYAVPKKSGLVVEFKETIAGKTQEALIDDVMITKAVVNY